VSPFFSDDDRAVLAAAALRLVPVDAGAVGYIELLLDAFSFDPPRLWAGGPFSGRHGGAASFGEWIPLGPMEEQAWRQRVNRWQEQYRELLAALGGDYVGLSPEDQDVRLAAVPELRDLLYEHTCEGVYGDPIYGGNAGCAGWDSIGWVGDVQPRGYTDVEVSQRERSPVVRRTAEG
jgi:hypothetical protein